jgi:hypothetical protein
MSRAVSMVEKANAYDKVGVEKHEVDRALASLKELRRNFPFAENLRSIEWLDPDKLFKVNPDEIGEFFHLLEVALRPLGNAASNSSNAYRNARLQIGDFKNLLRTTVDSRKSLAQKVDAPWDKIGGFGEGKQLAKKIIFCFNYEAGAVLPIFSNQHLRHFVNRVADTPILQTKYFSAGQEYEHYTAELLKAKNRQPPTKSWDSIYFARFLYNNYPPPDSEPTSTEAQKKTTTVTEDQLNMQGFMKLLGELQKQHKISGEQFRENRQVWIQQPSEREALSVRLKKLLSP